MECFWSFVRWIGLFSDSVQLIYMDLMNEKVFFDNVAE